MMKDVSTNPGDMLDKVTAIKQKCRVCGCTDDDCRGCFSRTGSLCHWIEEDLCSACEGMAA